MTAELCLFYLLRITNLELMVDYGCEAWKDYNDVLQDMVNKLQNRYLSRLLTECSVRLKMLRVGKTITETVSNLSLTLLKGLPNV